jgi:hypothetical protein
MCLLRLWSMMPPMWWFLAWPPWTPSAVSRPLSTACTRRLGSHAQWAAHLAARVWTITATAERNGQEPLTYLTEYLKACAIAGGKPPEGRALQPFLPGYPNPPTPPAAATTIPPRSPG